MITNLIIITVLFVFNTWSAYLMYKQTMTKHLSQSIKITSFIVGMLNIFAIIALFIAANKILY